MRKERGRLLRPEPPQGGEDGVGRREEREQVERRTVSKGQGEDPEEKGKWVMGTWGERMVGG